MKLEYYCLSAICQFDDAAIYAITKMKTHYFSGVNRKVFKIAIGLFKMKKVVDLHVFISQVDSIGIDDLDATLIYHYCLDYDDNWQNTFEELQRIATYHTIEEHIYELSVMRSNTEPISTISAKALRFASEWITDTEKQYYNGKEIDELREEFSEPILTGLDLYDKQLYKYGGNLKGQMKGVILREKHGKTRSECWEVAHNLKMGHKVLYLTLEGRKQDITGNVRQVLQKEWVNLREQLYVVDGIVGLDELEAIVTEAVLVDEVDKVVVDYMQLVQPSGRPTNENEKINIATERFRNLMVKLNFQCTVLNQARKENSGATSPKDAEGRSLMPSGYKHVPDVYDAYGSNALIKAASIIFIGFRPNQYEALTKANALGRRVVDPVGKDANYFALFMKVARTRYKPEYLNHWFQFEDTDCGLGLKGWV